jgi:hypothetical protein
MKQIKSASSKRAARFLKLTAFATLIGSAAAPLVVGCGSDESDLSCGTGTRQDGSTCVADLSNLGGAGGESGGQTTLDFDGVVSVAPASDTALLVVWGEASYPEATFNVYVAKSEDGFNFSTPQATAPAGSRSLEIAGLNEDTEYFVTVRAELNGKEEQNKVVKSGKTGNDSEAPSFAGATKAEPATAAAVRLSWKSASDDLTPDEALTYVVYFGTKSGEVDLEAPFAVSAPGDSSMVVSGLPLADTEYFFVVRARDAAGNMDDNEIEVSAKSGPDTTAPIFGGCTVALTKTATSVEVFWEPATDDTAAPDQIVYNLYASKTPDGQNFAEPHATITGGVTKGVVPGLSPDTTYYVVCRAADPSGNEEENVVARSAKTKDDDTPPVFAGITGLENITSQGFDVTWNAATDNQTAAADIVYDVFVASTSGAQDFEAMPAATSAPGATAVTIESLDSNTDYFIVVRARDLAANLSDNDEELLGTTLVSLLNDIELPIFQNKCATTGCHSGASPTGNMRLDPGFAWFATVNQPSQTGLGSGKDRVEPGDISTSHLYERIILPADNVNRMPPTGDLVDSTVIGLWIQQGALNN